MKNEVGVSVGAGGEEVSKVGFVGENARGRGALWQQARGSRGFCDCHTRAVRDGLRELGGEQGEGSVVAHVARRERERGVARRL